MTVRPPLSTLAPLAAILVGAAVAARAGVAPAAFAPSAAALLLGWLGWWSLGAGAARARWGERAAGLAPWLALAALAATLLAPGLDGVHRWLPLGPIRLGASAALAPWLLLGLAQGGAAARERAVLLVVAAQALHVAQPDAAQATALALGAAPLLLGRGVVRPALGRPALLLLAAGAALSWSRPDPLAPVAHVEGILGLARAEGPHALAAALLALALALLPLALPGRAPGTSRTRALAATLYALGALASSASGRFPVPLLGAGAAPVLGWVGLLALARLRREPDQPVPARP